MPNITILCETCQKKCVKFYASTRPKPKYCSKKCAMIGINYSCREMDEETIDAKKKQNFYSQIKISKDCWECSVCDDKGYGRVWFNNRYALAHRFSWELYYGPIPKGKIVRHKVCGNPHCCRPSHLALGDAKENYEDSRRMGRNCQGSNHGNSKINEEIAKEIKIMLKSGKYLHREIADKLKISRLIVKDISRGKTWRHISGQLPVKQD